MIVWGGYGFGGFVDTGARYDPVANSWTPTTVTPATPSARVDHSAVWTGQHMVIYGGMHHGDPFSESTPTGSQYAPDTGYWTVLPDGRGRARHSAVWTGEKMIAFGGYSFWYWDAGQVVMSTLYQGLAEQFDPSTFAWSPLGASDPPDGRGRHSTVWTGSEMIVWGGARQIDCCDGIVVVTPLQSGAIWTESSNTWRPMSIDSSPEETLDTPAVWTGMEMLIWNPPATARYDPGTDSWAPLTVPGGPIADIGHTAVWTGERMIVWGGRETSVDTNAGFALDPSVPDADGDGVTDPCDHCPDDYDPSNVDSDTDGAGDVCDCQPDDPNDRQPVEVAPLHAHRSGSGATSLSWAAAAAADVYSITRGDLSFISSSDYGSCLAEGIVETEFEDLDVPGSGEGFFYLVQGQSFDCGLGPLGRSSDDAERTNANAGACVGYPRSDVHAESEEPVAGSVTGDYTSTMASDDTVQAITEELSSGNPATRYSYLEHRWTVTVASGARIELHVEGYRTDTLDGDDFVFEYSTDGASTWGPISLSSLPLSDDDSDRIGLLPPDISGSVLIRAVDTDRTPGNQDLDTLSIDELFVRSIP
jgi:hypothetical protein